MDAPKGLILFSNTPIGKEFNESVKKLKIGIVVFNLIFLFSIFYSTANVSLIIALALVINA